MLSLYLAALVAALGAFAVQLAFGHHGGGGGHDVAHDGSDGHDAGAWSLLASVRFWSFALLAFGLVGTLLTLFGLAGKITTAVLAVGSGLSAGFFAAMVVRSLLRNSQSSHATGADVVGRVGRVIVPVEKLGRGKVRIDIKGSEVDYVARATEPLAVQEAVIVEEFDGSEVLVSRAPRELKE